MVNSKLKQWTCPTCGVQLGKRDRRHLNSDNHKTKLKELGIPENEDPALQDYKTRRSSRLKSDGDKTKASITFEVFQTYYNQYPDLDNPEYYQKFPSVKNGTIRSWKVRALKASSKFSSQIPSTSTDQPSQKENKHLDEMRDLLENNDEKVEIEREEIEDGIDYDLKNYKSLFEENIILYSKGVFNNTSMDIQQIIQDIENERILVPYMQRKVFWGLDGVNDLSISNLDGTPIGVFTLWRLSPNSEYVTPHRSILETTRKEPILKTTRKESMLEPEKEESSKYIYLVLDGLQRSSTLAAIYSRNPVKINKKFRNIELYYNFIADRFKYKEDIDDLDETWVSLKDTYSSKGYDAQAGENYLKKIKPILDRVTEDMKEKIRERIRRLFSIFGIIIPVDLYIGQDLNFAHNLLVKRNLGTKISPLDLLYSVISAVNPESRESMEKFEGFTIKKVGKPFHLKINDLLHLAVHLENPGTYDYSRQVLARINLATYDVGKIINKIKIITNDNTFTKFKNVLEDAVRALLPNGEGQGFKESEKNNQFSITMFRKKTSFYACYCLYLFCEEHQQKKEFHQFLAWYFLYNIITIEKNSKRETKVMLDLRFLKENSKDFKSLKRTLAAELSPQFWTETIPKKFLSNKARFADLAILYQLNLIQRPVFNGTNITVGTFLFGQNVKSVGWISIFHKEWFNKKLIHPNSILNKILVNFNNQSKRKLIRKEIWGWFKDIMLDKDISYANGMFDSWDFPRGFEEEMEEFSNKEKQYQIVEYLNDFFEKRAQKMSMSIKKTFFDDV